MAKLPTPDEAKARFERNKITQDNIVDQIKQDLKAKLLGNTKASIERSLEFPVKVSLFVAHYKLKSAQQLCSTNFDGIFNDAGYKISDVSFAEPTEPWLGMPIGSQILSFTIEPL